MTLRVQYGSGFSDAPSWANYDVSLSMRLERLPLVAPHGRRYPAQTHYGDIVRGLPVQAGSASAAFSSHVLEHLSYRDVWRALDNTFALLAPGGVFRLIVPDLYVMARRYVAAAEGGDSEAAHRFLNDTYLGVPARPRTPVDLARVAAGHSRHLWMWDEYAMAAALRRAGFVAVRRSSPGDAEDAAFAEVEASYLPSAASDAEPEFVMEALKPRVI